MDTRLTFDDNVINYDHARPDYPTELFNDVFNCIDTKENLNILEIGIGSGQATKPFLDKNYNVTAVELGNNFASFVKNKFSTYNNFNVICGDFMDVNLPTNYYDLIYSATAFHWLPFEKYNKILSLLNNNGALLLFWNRPFARRTDDITNQANMCIYNKYFDAKTAPKEFSFEDLRTITAELKEAGFSKIIAKIYKRTRTLSTNQYISLLNTYSDHRSLSSKMKLDFEHDMSKAINSVGGKINIYDTIDCYLARK